MPKKLNNSFELTTSNINGSVRLDSLLAKKYPQFTRPQWSEQISHKKVKLRGLVAKQSSRVKNGDQISGYFPEINATNILSSPKIIPEVIYKDDDVIVINKPAGLLTHGVSNKQEDSVSGAFKPQTNDNDPLRAGIVHRLDKQTSGVMILARNEQSKKFLQKQFSSRKVVKIYTTLVYGHLKNDKARLELPITRSHNNPQKMIISKQGKPAISEITVLKKYQDYTLVSVRIMTGRTHQIRVQMAYIGNPVVGDLLYGNKKTTINLDRQFLHASELTIELPSKRKKTFKVDLSDDLKTALEGLS
jgi:23S rRNA pseudouridine1911/1915/1917 synthase